MVNHPNRAKSLTMAQFITRNGLAMRIERKDRNPNMDDMGPGARHWLCTITKGPKEDHRGILVPFSQGSAHTKEPSLEEVLDCLASDAATVENSESFEGWASELGYDPDSRKAERIWQIVKRQARELEALLGRKAFNALLWNVDGSQ